MSRFYEKLPPFLTVMVLKREDMASHTAHALSRSTCRTQPSPGAQPAARHTRSVPAKTQHSKVAPRLIPSSATYCVALGNLLNLSVPPFLPAKWRDR